MLKSTLRLFKSLPLKDKKFLSTENFHYPDILKRTLENGYMFSPEVYRYFSESELNDVVSLVHEELILTAQEMNSTFHKSWNKVKTAPYFQLVMEQIVHYITTYGFKSLGVYDEESVYIPNEKLEIPDLDVDQISLMVIKGYTASELKEKLAKILQSGIALAEDTIEDVVAVANGVGFDELDIVKNKEVRMFLYKQLNQIPKDATEFLRYVIFEITGKTLLIKDKETIQAVIDSPNINVIELFNMYKNEHGLAPLATIFYRFKPLFLSFRSVSELKPVINKIRKLAVKYHKPMKEDYLNSVTRMIKDNSLSLDRLEKELLKVNVFRKIRLAYALQYRSIDGVDSILYKVRNGKGYVGDFSFDKTPMLKKALGKIVGSIIQDLSKNVDGKTIYIPESINYTLPATEKQFTGNFPSGTSVVIPRDLIFGVHWKNVNGDHKYDRSVDLDLSLISVDGKLGWDGAYRNDEGSILFSGDITDAPGKGATELFYVKKQKDETYLVYLNYFNYNAEKVVPFTIITAQKKLQSLKSNYMVDPNNVIAIASSKMDKKSKILGIISVNTNNCKFYFSETYVGNSITARNSKQTEQSKNYLVNFYKNSIKLDTLLAKAGAIVVREKSEDVEVDIDLSPENLEKDTILNLLV